MRTTALASSNDVAYPERGTASPMRSMACLNSLRSSAFLMAAILAPISSTPKRSSVPSSLSAPARFSAVSPQLLAEHAHALVDPLLDGARLQRRLALRRERGPVRLLAGALDLAIGDEVLRHGLGSASGRLR